MKIISDIRIYKGVGHTEIKNKIMNLSAHRAAMKLREKHFSLGEYDHLYICFSADIPAGSVVLDENVDKNFPWFRNALVGISLNELSEIETAEEPAVLFKQIESVLLRLFGREQSAQKNIKDAIEDAKKGPEMLMRFKEKETAKGKATIFLRLLNNAHYLPLLCVTNADGEEILRKNLPETIDLGTIGEIRLSSKKVTIMPRKNVLNNNFRPIFFEINL